MAQDLMFFSIDRWRSSRTPHVIRDSTLATFVRKIGPCNSNFIRSIELWSTSDTRAAVDVLLAEHICVYHMRGLESFQLLWDRLFWVNGPFEPLSNALEHFIETIYWLKRFGYSRIPDSRIPTIRFWEANTPKVMAKLEDLARVVATRAQRVKIIEGEE